MGAKVTILSGALLVIAVMVTSFGRLQSHSNEVPDVVLVADAIPERTIVSGDNANLPDESVKPEPVVSLVRLHKLVEGCMAYRKRRMSGEEGLVSSLNDVASMIDNEIRELYDENASAELLELINGDAMTCFAYARRAEKSDFNAVFVPEDGGFMSAAGADAFFARRERDEAQKAQQVLLVVLKERLHRIKQECFAAYRADGVAALAMPGCMEIFDEFGFPE